MRILQPKPRLFPLALIALASGLLFQIVPIAFGSSWASTADTANIVVDNTMEHQRIEGFGATHISLVYDGGLGDVLPAQLRAQAIDAAYNQVGLNTGNLEGALLESPGDYSQRTNDNTDPANFNWNGFQSFGADALKTNVVDLAQPYGFDDYFIGQKINVRWDSPWLDGIRNTDYARYLDETAEQVAAGQIYWRDTNGIVPQYQMLFNEPLSGNRELLNGTTQDVVDIVERAGERLSQEGFVGMKFVVPNEETTGKSLQTASAILSDPGARPYVGAIGYHVYPYGSTYSSIANILNTSGSGNPSASEIAVRKQLRDLGRMHGLPLWMTEVSHGGVDPRSFDSLRGRAIHIHDELVYADAAAYFGMLNMWDTESQEQHFGNRNLFTGDNEGNIVFIDTDTNTVHISGMGYAIGHYARWIEPGAVRIEAGSNDPLVQVTAFRDDSQGRLALVIINNAALARDVNVSLSDLALIGDLTGEQSTAVAAWQPVVPFASTSPSTFNLVVPAESVTTIAGQFDSTPPDEPNIEVSPTSLNFGLVFVGNFADDEVTINNTGAQPLTVSSLATTNNVFTVTSPEAPFDVAAGGSRMVTVRFSSTITGTQTGDLDITSNDPDEKLVTVSLSGEGLVDPCLGEVEHGRRELLGTVAQSEPPFCVFLPLLQK